MQYQDRYSANDIEIDRFLEDFKNERDGNYGAPIANQAVKISKVDKADHPFIKLIKEQDQYQQGRVSGQIEQVFEGLHQSIKSTKVDKRQFEASLQ